MVHVCYRIFYRIIIDVGALKKRFSSIYNNFFNSDNLQYFPIGLFDFFFNICRNRETQQFKSLFVCSGDLFCSAKYEFYKKFDRI